MEIVVRTRDLRRWAVGIYRSFIGVIGVLGTLRVLGFPTPPITPPSAPQKNTGNKNVTREVDELLISHKHQVVHQLLIVVSSGCARYEKPVYNGPHAKSSGSNQLYDTQTNIANVEPIHTE